MEFHVIMAVKPTSQKLEAYTQHHSHEDDHDLAIMPDHGHDNGYSQPVKTYVHLNKDGHSHNDDHGPAVMVYLDKDEDGGSPCQSDHSHDFHHGLVVTHNHSHNQNHSLLVKPSNLQC